VWLVLEEKKIPYQYKEVNPYHKEPSFLALNPRGLVPTLEVSTADGHKPLYESTVLLEYLEDAYPNHGPSLYPNNPYDKAKVKIWADFVTSRIIPAFHRFLQYQPNTGSGTPEGLEKLRQEFLGKLVEFTREMDPVGPYFTGKEPVLVDFVLAPWAVRLWVFDEFKGGLGKPEKSEDQKVWERWGKWLEAVKGRDSIKRTTSDAQHYLPIYKR
jgi:glutathione S-transferase